MQGKLGGNSFVTSLSIGIALAVPATVCVGGGSKCVDGQSIRVCVEWSQTADPDPAFDFHVDFSNQAAPNLELITGDPGWIVRSRAIGTGDPADFGSITCPHEDSFVVSLGTGYQDPGASNVGSMDLTPKVLGAPNPYYSSIAGGAILGNLNGNLVVVENSSGVGGSCAFFVLGAASGKIVVPNVLALRIFSVLSGSLTVGDLYGDIELGPQYPVACGAVPMVSGPISIGTIHQGGYMIISGDLQADLTVDALDAGTLIYVSGAVGDVRVDLGPIGTGGQFHTFVTLTDVGSPSNCEFGGDLSLASGINADTEVKIYGHLGTNASIDLMGRDMSGLLYIEGGGTGAILNGGDVSGPVTLSDTADHHFEGTATFASVSSGGTIQTSNGAEVSGTLTVTGSMIGRIDVGADLSGDVSIGGALSGAVTVINNVSGDIDITGDVSSTGVIDIDGGLVRYGRVLVAGTSDGYISIHKDTSATSLVHLLGGLDANGKVTINAGQADKMNAGGDIYVGPTKWTQMPNVIFDGNIHIYDGPATGGDLNGDITVVGCHATADDLAICVEGAVNGKVSLVQSGCANQVGWCCSPPCP